VEKPKFDAWVACQKQSDKDRPKEGCGSVIAGTPDASVKLAAVQ
jgi:hypothetical protein